MAIMSGSDFFLFLQCKQYTLLRCIPYILFSIFHLLTTVILYRVHLEFLEIEKVLSNDFIFIKLTNSNFLLTKESIIEN